jgi:hypothetical protein
MHTRRFHSRRFHSRRGHAAPHSGATTESHAAANRAMADGATEQARAQGGRTRPSRLSWDATLPAHVSSPERWRAGGNCVHAPALVMVHEAVAMACNALLEPGTLRHGLLRDVEPWSGYAAAHVRGCTWPAADSGACLRVLPRRAYGVQQH